MVRRSRQENQDLTRQRLREAAATEFARSGVGAASIDRITEAAGFSRGAFYSNYASKHDLALELLTEANLRATAVWHRLIESTEDPATLLTHLAAEFDRVASHPELWLLNMELRLEAERDPDFRERHEAVDARVLEAVRAMVRSLCRHAGVEATADADYIAFVVQSFTQGLPFERHKLPLPGVGPGQLLVRLVLDLMGNPPPLAAAAKAIGV